MFHDLCMSSSKSESSVCVGCTCSYCKLSHHRKSLVDTSACTEISFSIYYHTYIFYWESKTQGEICGGEERLSHQHHTYAVFLPWQPSYVQMLSGIIIRCDHNITDFISAALCTVKPLLTFMFCIFITCPNLMKTDYKLDNMLYLFGSQRPLI